MKLISSMTLLVALVGAFLILPSSAKSQAGNAVLTSSAQAPSSVSAHSIATGLQGTRTLVGLATYGKRNLKIAYAAGPVNGQSGETARPDTPFRLASISKTFTAAAVFKLIEQGRFTLASPIVSLLSTSSRAQLQAAHVQMGQITVAQLLSHRSGLPDYASTPAFIDAIVSTPNKRWTRAEQLAIALSQDIAAPDSNYRYADSNYILLGDIIERSTGLSLAQSLRQLLNFNALGLNQTYLESAEPTPAGLRPRLHSFVQGFDTFAIDPSFDLYGGGGLVSTAEDLTRFYRALFSNRIVNASSLRAMTQSVAGGGFNEFAYSMGLMPFYLGNTECFGHEGFASVVAGHCPSLDYTFVYAAGSDQIPDIKLTQRGIGTRVADAIGIDTTPTPYADDFERTRCPPELLASAQTKVRVSCGILAVDQVRGLTSTRKLHIPVLIAKHASKPANLQPLLLLGGGPGDALFPSLSALLGNAELTNALLDGQDLIAAEYRGTGAADPKLQCDARLTGPATVSLCLEKMARLGVNLQRYNGVEFAADIEQLRRSLRVTRWNLAGFSYGTRAALTILRERPSTVRSLVLDGVDSPNESFADPVNAARALDEYFRACEQDSTCRLAFPALKSRFVRTMQELNNMPLLLDGVSVRGDNLVQSLTLFQADPNVLAYIPAIMDRYAQKDIAFIGGIIDAPSGSELLPPDPSFSDAVFFSAICNESVAFANRANYLALANGNDPIVRAYARLALDSMNICTLWPSGRGSIKESQDVPLSVPSMVLNSTFDLQTPAVDGRALVARNARTTVGFEFPVGHIALQQAPECALSLLIQFQRSSNASQGNFGQIQPSPIDGSCVRALGKVQWAPHIDDAFYLLIGRGG